MPRYIENTWADYKVGLVPYHDKNIGWLGELWHYHIMPFFYGPISFDLVVIAPTKKASLVQEIDYKWTLQCSETGEYDSNSVIGSPHEGSISLINTPHFRGRKMRDGDTTHYVRRNTFSRKTTTFRKHRAVDLGWVSKLAQYRIMMEFTDNTSVPSGDMIMLEFRVKDYDEFKLNMLNIIIGTTLGLIAGAISGAVVAFLFGAR